MRPSQKRAMLRNVFIWLCNPSSTWHSKTASCSASFFDTLANLRTRSLVSAEGTAAIRRRAMEVFHRALSVERLPRDLEQLLPLALWSLQMGLLVMFLYDDSADQKRTRRLAAGSIDFAHKMITLAKLPVLKPMRSKVLALLREACLLS